MIFIITILLLAADFYYLKNIAGRRLVGLRWWNEVDPATGDSHWVFESSEPGTKVINATDSRFFWLAIYAQPLLWILLAIVALFSLKFIWLPLVGMCFLWRVGWEKKSEDADLEGVRSHCTGLDDYQQLGLFALRQIQPGVEPGGERAQLGESGGEYCEQHGWEVLLEVERACLVEGRIGLADLESGLKFG